MNLMDYEHLGQLDDTSGELLLSPQTRGAQPSLDIDAEIKKFPKTRFYGSKRRLLNWIYHALKDVRFKTVLDGFGGTGSVSLLFKTMGKEVTYHDGLLFNSLAAQALLAEDFPFASIDEPHKFIDGIQPTDGFISETFQGMYYTDAENRWLDGAATAIHQISEPAIRNVYLYGLFQACLKKRPFNLFHRANLNLRLNTGVKRSFGNAVTWETPFPILMKASLSDLIHAAKGALHKVNFLPPGDVTKVNSGYDLVYLDPPYVNGSSSTDDYLRRYHFLEGLSDYGGWANSVNLSSHLKELNPRQHIRDWQSKRIFQERLFSLVAKHHQSIVVLSYLSGAYPSEDEITLHFERNFKQVHVLRKDFCHALAKEKRIELLFIGSNL